MPAPNPSSSSSEIQQRAEAAIVAAAAEQLGVSGGLTGNRRVEVMDRYVEVDGASEDGVVLVEAYARQGTLKGAQLKKIAQDILKFALVRKIHPDARTVVAFASGEARQSVSGWLETAAREFMVELVYVPITDELRSQILAAQRRQKMVNADADADAVTPDVAPEPDSAS